MAEPTSPSSPDNKRPLMSTYRTDAEIARSANKLPIAEVAREARHSRAGPHSLRPRQGQDRLRLSGDAEGQAGRQADPGHGDLPDAGRRRQDHDHGRPGRRPEQDRQEGHHLPARAQPGPVLRHEGRRRRRRLCPGGADDRHQPALHRRLPRHRCGAQPAVRGDRQPHSLGQLSSISTRAASPGGGSST